MGRASRAMHPNGCSTGSRFDYATTPLPWVMGLAPRVMNRPRILYRRMAMGPTHGTIERVCVKDAVG